MIRKLFLGAVMISASACDRGDHLPNPVTPTSGSSGSGSAALSLSPSMASDAGVDAAQADRSIELAKDQAAPTKIVVTATDILWIDEGNGNETGGMIMKLSKAGGPIVALAKDQTVPMPSMRPRCSGQRAGRRGA